MALNLHRSHRGSRNSDGVASALENEAQRAPNCWHLNGTGKLEEGISLELNHPLTGGRPALFVGGFFIPRHFKTGCLYRPERGRGHVRRVDVFEMERENQKPLKLLVQPEGGNVPLLLHVNTNLPEGRTPKERFWVGMEHNGECVAFDDQEALLRFTRVDAAVTVYYADGMVVRIERQGDWFKVNPLSVEEQAAMRIAHAQTFLKEAGKLVGDERVRREDFAYHQFIAVMAVGGKRSDSIFQEVYDYLLGCAEAGEIRPSVKAHAVKALTKHWAGHALAFGQACERGFVKSSTHSGNLTSVGATPASNGASPETLRKKAEKRERDRELRNRMKGASSGGSQQHNNKKKKKGR